MRRVLAACGAELPLVWIESGSFRLGSPATETGREPCEGPQTAVTISSGFWLGATPVTQAQWRAVMGDAPSMFQGEDKPVERISRSDAWAFCARVSADAHLAVTLPTEAQWEYACRAGTTTAYWWGEDITGGRATHDAASTTAVTAFDANPWGLYDMHGNVYEWCADGFAEYPGGHVVDPRGDNKGFGVFRGGSWDFPAHRLRAAGRYRADPAWRLACVGLRIAVTR